MATAAEILEAIRDNASADYQERVSDAQQTALEQVGDSITATKNIMNEFITSLVDKVAFTHLMSKAYQNELARVKKVGVPLGNTIEETFINPVTDGGYDNTQTKLLVTSAPDGKVAYYGLNRKSCYPITINETEISRAFTSEQAFQEFYAGIIAQMYSGDSIDEFMMFKGVLGKAIDADAMTMVDCDLAAPKVIAKTIKNLSKFFTFPSTTFAPYNKVNAAAITAGETAANTFCKMDRQVLILRADVETEIDYEVLATMFHIEATKLEAMTILVDEIPSETYDVYAVLCDIDSIQIRDKTFKMTSQYIANTLEWNFWLHHWQWLFLSMFGNCVALGKAKVVTP